MRVPPRFPMLFSVLLLLACLAHGDILRAADGAGARSGMSGKAACRRVAGSGGLFPSHGNEGIGPWARLPGSRPFRSRRRKLRDDDSGDGGAAVDLRDDNEKRKIGIESAIGYFSGYSPEKGNWRVIRVLLPGKGSGVALSALHGSLLLSRPPPPDPGTERIDGWEDRRESTEIGI